MADERIPFATHAESTVLGADEIILNMGPQHPSTHGVLRVKLRLDGEKVIGSECVIGYLHRGVEKIAEHRSYQQFAPYVDRMDYVAAVSNGLGYCEAVEKLLGAEAPLRARVIRVILTELQRIASHLFWLGTHALDIGALTPLFYCLREREEILKIFEKYCGARLTTHAFRIGGLQYEAYDELEKDVERGSAGYCDLEVVGEHGDPLEELFDQDPTLVVVRLGPDAREVGRSQLSMNLRCRMPRCLRSSRSTRVSRRTRFPRGQPPRRSRALGSAPNCHPTHLVLSRSRR